MIIVIIKDGDPQIYTKAKHHELVCPVHVLLSTLILPITKHTTFVTKGKQFLNSIKITLIVSSRLEQIENITTMYIMMNLNFINDTILLTSTLYKIMLLFLVTPLYTSRKLYNNIFYPNFSFITNPIFIAHISYNCVIYLRHMNMYLSI